MEELKDIKDIVEVQEYSLIILIGISFVALLLLMVALYFFKNRRRRNKKPTKKEIALEKLKNIDYNNTKEIVYTFEEEVQSFLTEKNQEAFNRIINALQVYKYKKEIPPFTTELKEQIQTFIKGLK